LCDFGWATYSPNKEMRSTICGTLLYMAPEVINMDDYGDSVDVWAIGVLTYELMTDENPFKITKMSDISKIVLFS
jgi:aurora kinase, other